MYAVTSGLRAKSFVSDVHVVSSIDTTVSRSDSTNWEIHESCVELLKHAFNCNADGGLITCLTSARLGNLLGLFLDVFWGF